MLGHGKRGFEYQAWCNSSFQNFPTSTEDVPFEQNWLPYDNIMLVLEVKCLWLSLSFLLSLCLSCHLVSLSLCMLRFWEQQCTNCVSGKKRVLWWKPCFERSTCWQAAHLLAALQSLWMYPPPPEQLSVRKRIWLAHHWKPVYFAPHGMIIQIHGGCRCSRYL